MSKKRTLVTIIMLWVAFLIRDRWIPLMNLTLEAFWATLPGYHPQIFFESYLSAPHLSQFSVGMVALCGLLAVLIGLPHFLINLIALFHELRLDELRLHDLRLAQFILRQRRCQKKYLLTLSQTQTKEINSEPIQELLTAARKQDQSWIEKTLFQWFEPKAQKISSFTHALRHFLFSYDSFTRSTFFYTRVWNEWFKFRAFFPLFHPVLTAVRLFFPNYFHIATSQYFKRTLPTRLNGGFRPFWTYWWYVIFARKTYQKIKKIDATVIRSHQLIRAYADPKNTDPQSADRAILFWESRVLRSSEKDIKLNLTPPEAELIALEAEKTHPRPKLSLLTSIVNRIDPDQSREVQIIQICNRQLQNPKAIVRAVRSTVAGNLIDKPLELLFLFASYATIQEGILRPLHPELFGPDSWFYLSRYVFLNGFIYSMIASIFSEAWLKIQQDSMNEGQFDCVPEEKDKQKSFLAWYLNQTFFRKDNSFFKNQIYAVSKYILPTLKATLVTAFCVNLITLGRFDLDVFIAQTLILIFFPLTGLSWKLEQGFEFASAWVVRNIPAPLRSHPSVQNYALAAIAKKRLVFNFFFKVFDCISWNFAVAFMSMNTLTYGERSFCRILFGGQTPTEITSNFLHHLSSGMPDHSFLYRMLHLLDLTITKNY